uniref:SWIM-type domain-containing protein n=1 Tax=Romanomermis culicivorax TaxID=13658 RepID=A0A915HQX1_ROMCU
MIIPLVQMQEPPPFVPWYVNTQMRLSQYLLTKNLVTLVPDKQVFIVEDSKKKYLVQFEPYTCTCSVCQCHHILATHISCGLKTKVKMTKNIMTLQKQEKGEIPLELSQLWVSLDLALVGSFKEAMLLWTKHLHNIGALGPDKFWDMGNMIHIDKYGMVENVFIDVIKPLVHLPQTSTCSNINCSNKEVVTGIDSLNKKTTDKVEKFVPQEFRRCYEQCEQ